uniref:Phosphatase tensin-type domain-containing protein n=1 Tax=Myripristis murdjan TaxID=586833 RepID=A0A667YUF6_9TELE
CTASHSVVSLPQTWTKHRPTSVMEKLARIDLTYITERMITIIYPVVHLEESYLQDLRTVILMLQSKHGHNYLLINLSEKNDSLTKMNHKIVDTGWVDCLAPSLNQIYGVCTIMENWLQAHSNVCVCVHNYDPTDCGVRSSIIMSTEACLFHLNIRIFLSADLSLEHFAMRRFYNDQVSALMTPSQKRPRDLLWLLTSDCKFKLHTNYLFLL